MNTDEAEKCETTLASIEVGEVKAVSTPHVIEEVSFKLLIAKASEVLKSRNVWEIRDRLRKDEALRQECYEILRKFIEYVRKLCFGGLRIIEVYSEDVFKIPDMFKEIGLLTTDCLHLSVMRRLNLKAIATLDEDFKQVKGVTVIP